MVDFDNFFDELMVCVDIIICGLMGVEVRIILGFLFGVMFWGVFDDLENIGYVEVGI